VTIRLRVISLGAGVQSTTLALMASRGDIPQPDCAIFADTGWEPKRVYQHLDWLKAQLPFPVHMVSSGNIRDDAMAGESKRSGRFASIPWFVLNPNGSSGMGRRQCTTHYKVEPIRKKVRELLGRPHPMRVEVGSVEMIIGISLDEIIRAVPSKVKFERKVFPLLEARMTRRDCIKWLAERQYPIPTKSACLGCPFHDNDTWREIKKRPDDWADVIQVDAAIRDATSKGFRGQQFMHAQRVPIGQVDLSTAEDRGQLNLFINDCEGMCGV
jgi:hypothetical protein